MQEVELDSKIKLIDCPGIVFTSIAGEGNENAHAVLKNAQRVGDVKDPFSIAESVLKRASKEYFCKMYDITNYDNFEEFFAKKAARMGKSKFIIYLPIVITFVLFIVRQVFKKGRTRCCGCSTQRSQ